MVTAPRICTLVSASCTTGWLDWLHGELWVCPDGLLRRPLGLRATIAHGTGPTVDFLRRPTRAATELDLNGRGVSWIPWPSIERAQLKSGPVTDSLHLLLRGGRQNKLLWLAADGARQYLEAALPGHLGSRLV